MVMSLGMLSALHSTTHPAYPCLCSADGAQHSTQADTSQQVTEPQEAEEEEYDPYTPLDPHATGILPIKPFKKGRKPSARRRPKEADPLELSKLGEPKRATADKMSAAPK